MTTSKLDFSIPANNSKIIELYNKLKKEELDPNPYYQRKLVWKKPHKYRFIQTILLNYPFPEIYLAPGTLDTDTLELKDEIVDGQQRLTTIRNYIESTDVFALKGAPFKRFSDLEKDEKEAFLNYEVSVRYLKNAKPEQIKDIFQRINSTEYSLNKTERTNAQWGESEFICFGKQIIETDLGVDTDLINYKIDPINRQSFLDFFHKEYNVFNETDISRMYALQFILTLLATICEQDYFKRNDKVQTYIESYYEVFKDAAEVEENLIETLNFIRLLKLEQKSYWFNKANLFTLITELYKVDVSKLDPAILKEKLSDLDTEYRTFSLLSAEKKAVDGIKEEYRKYFSYAKEAVNDKPIREFRAKVVKSFIDESKYDGVKKTAESGSITTQEFPEKKKIELEIKDDKVDDISYDLFRDDEIDE